MPVKPEHIGSALFAALLALVLGSPWDPADGFGDHRIHTGADRDLGEIKRDTLRVLVLVDPLSWEQRPGAMTGLEWELLERFAHHYRIPAKAIPVPTPERMLAMLHNGSGDIIAAQLSAHGWAASQVLFTRPYRHVRPAVAVPSGSNTTGAPDTITISRWSPFLDSLGQPVIPLVGMALHTAPDVPELLLAVTSLGQHHALLVSDATVRMESKRLPTVQFEQLEGDAVPLRFAVRQDALHLLHLLDTWLARAREHEARQALFRAYDSGLETRRGRSSSLGFTFGTDSISQFDSLFQQVADTAAWDWKLLAAVAFRESGFDTTALSYAGAGGLMQLMPRTAALMGLSEESGVGAHIEAANGYLAKLDSTWRKQVPSANQRLRFMLASYNAGPGHVRDGQQLATLFGLDPARWDNNVERAIVLLNRPRFFTRPEVLNGYCRGQDTYWYVRDVTGLYARMLETAHP